MLASLIAAGGGGGDRGPPGNPGMFGRIGDNGPAGSKGPPGSVISINGYIQKNDCNWACACTPLRTPPPRLAAGECACAGPLSGMPKAA